MKTVAISILGTQLDQRGRGNARWERWRPNLSMCQHDDLIVDRLELIHDNHSIGLANQLCEDVGLVSPETRVNLHCINFHNPWDFESVYAALLDFAKSYPFKPTRENYLIHITTGTHVAQICLYLLTEAGYLPGRLLQTSPGKPRSSDTGQYQIIDLDLSKYDQIASRFKKEHDEGTSFLKGGIQTRNAAFNRMIEQLEKVSLRSRAPILLTGPTGAGKSQLARRVFELRQHRRLLDGKLVTVNCATLKGENAMSALFGHKKGAFTGATTDRLGLLREADKGLLFLDEIGELGLDEQAMLLRAIEDKSFLPLGADRETSSDFQLIAGTNRDLLEQCRTGGFREDLLARIDLWTYQLPSLRERVEDLEPNIDFELEKFSNLSGSLTTFNRDARSTYLQFARSGDARWTANFRDLNASITRMGTLADGGRITTAVVREEIQRLQSKWQPAVTELANTLPNLNPTGIVAEVLGTGGADHLDYFEQLQLAALIHVCRTSTSMADAGRKLFNVSRLQKSSVNDSHRVRQLLNKYQLSFDQLKTDRAG